MQYYESVLDLIGNTPLVRLGSVTDGLAATVLAKVEYLNPGGSIKDRIAQRMIDEAEASGALRPGGTFAGTDILPHPLLGVVHLFDTMVLVDPRTLPARLEAAGFTGVQIDVRGHAFRFRARTKSA